MTVPDRRVVTDAVITMLEGATGRPVGDFDAPGDGDSPEYPYLVVTSIPGGGSSGIVGNPADTLTIVYQLTSVGLRRDQAEQLAARAHEAMLAIAPSGEWVHPISASGHSIGVREHDASGGTDFEGPVVNAVERYTVAASVTP